MNTFKIFKYSNTQSIKLLIFNLIKPAKNNFVYTIPLWQLRTLTVSLTCFQKTAGDSVEWLSVGTKPSLSLGKPSCEVSQSCQDEVVVM